MRILLVILVFTLFACSSKKKETEKPKVISKEVISTEKMEKGKEAMDKAKKDAAKAAEKKHTLWSYSGLTGPEMWGDLREEYKTCKHGTRQSPIDLVWKKPVSPSPITFHYSESPYNIMDNGHTIQALFEPGNYVTKNNERWDLVQLHFHARSEHSLSGKFFPIEAHLEHKNAKGQHLVVAVLFEKGEANPYLESMWQQIPKDKNRKVASPTRFNPKGLIPKQKTHYSYLGSMAIPPCTEGVDWNVFNTPMEMSESQMNHFKVMYSNNFRPVQNANDRTITNF